MFATYIKPVNGCQRGKVGAKNEEVGSALIIAHKKLIGVIKRWSTLYNVLKRPTVTALDTCPAWTAPVSETHHSELVGRCDHVADLVHSLLLENVA
jgi:hypothetical protein